MRYLSFVGVRVPEDGAPFRFVGAAFRGGVFRDCSFPHSAFDRSDFSECHVEDVEFTGGTFHLFGFHGSRLERVTMRGSDASSGAIIGCHVQDSRFVDADWSESNLHDNLFAGCVFERVRLDGASVHHNDFYRCHFRSCDLTGPTMDQCVFTDCTFEDVTLDVDAFKRVTGIELGRLQGIRLRDGDREADTSGLAARLEEEQRSHRERAEVLEAAFLAVALARNDLLESLLADVPRLLARDEPGAGAQWIDLSRRLTYWVGERKVDPYWLLWVHRAMIDRLRATQREGAFPDPHLMEAAALLSAAARAYQAEVARSAFAMLPEGGLLDEVRLVIEAPGATSPEDLDALLSQLEGALVTQVPPALRTEAGILRMRHVRHWRGSFFAEYQTWMLGAALFLTLTLQAGAHVVRKAEDTVVATDGLVRASYGLIRTFREEHRRTFPPTAPAATPAAPVAASALPTAPALGETPGAATTREGLRNVAERNLGVNISEATVLPPELRPEVLRLVLSVEVRR